MGDRITTYLPCPNCKKETEQYDAPSCLIWSWNCEHCGWKDDRVYFEDRVGNIHLCTEQEAKEKGYILVCPKCVEDMTASEDEVYGMCYQCKQKVDKKNKKTKK